MLLDKTVAFLPNMCYNNKENEKRCRSSNSYTTD